MAKIGYARVSSTGQRLDIQLEKLRQAECERLYQEKRSGRTAHRPQYQACMDYLREGDTLIVTRLDRLARSVIAEFENDLRSERQAEGIAKAKENGVRFGRPAKLTESLRQDIYFRRQSGATIGQLAKEFRLGEATIYRVLKTFKSGDN
ncbi:recombinase family protein [Salmonella enterica]|nr:recombinase family protein [Salmonella enterica]EGY9635885.1 recombinase family protein [Salmonella enterica subsp. enterica serovar Rough O:c:z]EIE7938889.1 recombinase family protein [Salmonella enterica]